MKGVKNFVENIFASRSANSIRSNNDEFQRLSSFDFNQINEGLRESCVSLQSEQQPRPGTTVQQSEIELKSLPLKLKEEDSFDRETSIGNNSRDDGSTQSNSESTYNHEFDNEFKVYNPTSVELPEAFSDETFPLALSDVRLAIKDFVTGERNEDPVTAECNLHLGSSSEPSCCNKFLSSACTTTSGKDHAVILCLFLIPLGCLFFGLGMVGWNHYKLNDESSKTDLQILASLQWPLHDVKSRRANITFRNSKDEDQDGWNFQKFEDFITNTKHKNETPVTSANANINRNGPPKFNGHEIDENILMESYDVSRRFIDGKLRNDSSKLEILLWRGIQAEVMLEELHQRLHVSETNGSIEGELSGPLCYNDSTHRSNCNKTAWFRSADGSCNNVLTKNYGSLYAPFRTIINHEKQIGDSFVNFSDILSGEQRHDPESSLLLPLWGIFLLHDTVKIPDSPVKCCNDGISVTHTLANRKTCYKFQSMKGDELNDEYKCTSIHHPPAIFPTCKIEDHGTSFNLVTSFIDASNIYGSSEEITDTLRDKSSGSGQMKVLKMQRKGTAQHNKSSIFAHEKGFLQPVLGQNHTCPFGSIGNFGDDCVLSGDDDVNQIAHITALNTILLRQHNWLAFWLHRENPHWNDERIFQESRRILIAQIQHITYNEFLPEIIGKDLMNSSDLSLNNQDFYTLYDPKVDASVSTVYASAVGHFVYSMTSGNVKLLWKKGKYLRQAQFDIRRLIYFLHKHRHSSAVGALLFGAARTNANKVGIEFPIELQSMYLESKNSTVNLVKMIIARGQELGLVPYVKWRKVCGLPDVGSFDDLQNYWYPEAYSKIKTVYRSVNEVDLFIGMLAENPLPSARVGPTLACLLADQFLRFKMGDRHWYEGNVYFHHFSSEQLDAIRQTTLARLICDNTEDNFNEIQKWPMLITKESNPTLSCSDPQIPPFDFSPWKENFITRKQLHVTVRKHTMNSVDSEELANKDDDEFHELYDSDENNLNLQLE